MRAPRGRALLMTVIVASAAAAGATATSGASTRTTSVGIGAREFRLSVYKQHVPAGRLRFNVTNYGEDAHDLRVLGPGGASTIRATSPEIKAGDSYTLKVTLRRRGLYRLVCTLADHESRGMVARIRVVKRS